MRDRPREQDAPELKHWQREREHGDGFDKMERMLSARNPDFDVQAFRRRVAETRERHRADGVDDVDGRAKRAADRIRNLDKAQIDPRKFTHYSMDPEADNDGKWKAWRDVGHDVYDSAARERDWSGIEQQIRQRLPDGRVTDEWTSKHGLRYEVETEYVGPNGKRGTLASSWQFDEAATEPRMITHWLKVHRVGRYDD